MFSFEGTGPTLPQDASAFWVAPNALLIGDVRLGRDASVWFGAVLRADSESIVLGTGTNVQDNAVFHCDPGFPIVIGDYCTIGHQAIVHGCTIADHTLVGMGALILNGARVGKHCLIGANSLVGENKVIPDYSVVVGSPGKVIAQLDAAGQERVQRAAQNYIGWWKRYRAGLAPT